MTNIALDDNQGFDYSNDQISTAELTEQQRQSIYDAAGDASSIQGSIADAAQMSLLALGQLLIQLKAGKSIEEIIASDQVFAACIEFALNESEGKMKVPFKYKPEGEALADIIKRTDAVAGLY